MARLVILSGPSGIGKSPLLRVLQRFYPDLAGRLHPLVLYNDRAPRPGEQDGVAYHFRSRAEIEALAAQPGFIVLPVRRDLQALDVAQVTHLLAQGRDALFEGNPYVAQALATAPQLATTARLSVFLSPVSQEEIAALRAQPGVDLEATIVEVMRRKQQRRMARWKPEIGPEDQADIEARCRAAFAELHYAPRFDWVLPNHDGEDSENWDAFPCPLGDARRCLLDFAAILQGQTPRYGERWPADLLPG